MSVASKIQINSILLKIKESIEKNQGRNFIFRARDKNQETLLKLGMLPSHVKDEVLQLTYIDYCKGPEQNKSRSGNIKGSIWTFGRDLEDIEVYIKLHVIPYDDTQCVCISFHEAAEALYYPYKN